MLKTGLNALYNIKRGYLLSLKHSRYGTIIQTTGIFAVKSTFKNVR